MKFGEIVKRLLLVGVTIFFVFYFFSLVGNLELSGLMINIIPSIFDVFVRCALLGSSLILAFQLFFHPSISKVLLVLFLILIFLEASLEPEANVDQETVKIFGSILVISYNVFFVIAMLCGIIQGIVGVVISLFTMESTIVLTIVVLVSLVLGILSLIIEQNLS